MVSQFSSRLGWPAFNRPKWTVNYSLTNSLSNSVFRHFRFIIIRKKRKKQTNKQFEHNAKWKATNNNLLQTPRFFYFEASHWYQEERSSFQLEDRSVFWQTNPEFSHHCHPKLPSHYLSIHPSLTCTSGQYFLNLRSGQCQLTYTHQLTLLTADLSGQEKRTHLNTRSNLGDRHKTPKRVESSRVLIPALNILTAFFFLLFGFAA